MSEVSGATGSGVPDERAAKWSKELRMWLISTAASQAGVHYIDTQQAVALLDDFMALADAEVAAAVSGCRRDQQRREADRERYIGTLIRERDKAERKVRAVETVTCWTNEDGKRFMFVDDVAVALEIPGAAALAGEVNPE